MQTKYEVFITFYPDKNFRTFLCVIIIQKGECEDDKINNTCGGKRNENEV